MPGTLRSITDRFLATLILHPFRRARQPEEMWGFGLLLPAASSRGRCLLARRLDARVSSLYHEGRSGSDGCSGFPDVGEHPVVGLPGILGGVLGEAATHVAALLVPELDVRFSFSVSLVPDRASEPSPPELIEVSTNSAPTQDEEPGSSRFSRISLAQLPWTLPVRTTKFSVPPPRGVRCSGVQGSEARA